MVQPSKTTTEARSLERVIARRDIALPSDANAQVTAGANQREENTPEKLLAAAAPPVLPLLALAAARLPSGFMTNPAFINRPNILTLHRFFSPAGEQIAALEAIDIASNEVEVDLAAPDAFQIRVWQGVLDTNLEASAGFAEATGNVGEAFARAKGWALFTPSQRSALDSLSLPPDARRTIVEDLESGYVVVTPESPVQQAGEQFVGWWRINQATGDTLGIAADHQNIPICRPPFRQHSLTAARPAAERIDVVPVFCCVGLCVFEFMCIESVVEGMDSLAHFILWVWCLGEPFSS
jgi:hypothetical protein